MDILRSLLFVPAGRERMLEHAADARADAIVLDLEDAVAPRQKVAARALAKRWLPRLAKGRRRVFVRVNGLASGLTRDDLMTVVGRGLHAVVLPKAQSPQDLRDLDVLLREAEMANGVRPGDVRTMPLIESARGVLRCEEIARASDRVFGLSVGGEDYSADIGVRRDVSGAGLAHIRAVVVQVSAAYGLLPVDTPYVAHTDLEGLAADTAVAKGIGLKGKYAVHPAQVPVINRALTPSADEIAQAQQIVDAYDAKRDGAINVNGRMVDAPVVARAWAILEAGKRRK